MKTDIVSPEKSLSVLNLKFNQHTRDTAIKQLKKDLAAFVDVIEKFAAQYPGQITVGESLWLNGTVKIEAEPAIAEKLKKVKGVGDVSEPRKITFDVIPPAPKP